MARELHRFVHNTHRDMQVPFYAVHQKIDILRYVDIYICIFLYMYSCTYKYLNMNTYFLI